MYLPTKMAQPHSKQAEAHPDKYQIRSDIPFDRVLKQTAPQEKYRSRQDEVNSTIHWGQRKLLMSEIEFLTIYGEFSDTVVYAGAASGIHIAYLARLFPNHKFYLYDPNPFSPKLRNVQSIRTFNQLFLDETARQYQGSNILFISDIRTADPKTMTAEEVEIRVAEDHLMQQQWVNIMNPVASMLKLRFPWKDGKTMYLNGEIRLPVWGPNATTETRLIVSDNVSTIRYRIYDNRQYENQMFWFNTVKRIGIYPHNVKATGLDYCFDCRSEVQILENYLKKYNPDVQDINRQIGKMIDEISNEITPGRTLLTQIKKHTIDREEE